MAFSKQKKILGLDVGQSTVKAVVMGLRGKEPVVLDTRKLDCREEGILDETELREQLRPWLSQIGWARENLIVGVPQYMATTQVSDFPEGSGAELANMVAYETQQLAGLSEERFLHDYHPLGALHGRRNAVLIGICRHSVITERVSSYTALGLKLADFAMNGLAMANAYFDLYPDSLEINGPQLILDIGAENSTLAIIADGQPLFVSSLVFASEKYTQAVARKLGVKEEEAEEAKKNIALDPTDAESPVYQATRLLENELRTAVDHWRSQERPELASRMFARLCLTGGGAQLTGLAEYLGRSFGCEAEVIGFPVPDTDPVERDPTLLTAYGLAIQGLGKARANVSLAPDTLKWLLLRRQSFGQLVAAVVMGLLLLGGWLFKTHRDLTTEHEQLGYELARLEACEEIIPDLGKQRDEIRHRERMLLPIVDRGNRARKYVEAIHKLAEARDKDDWFIYLADLESFQADRTAQQNPTAQTNTPEPPSVDTFRLLDMDTDDDQELPDTAYPNRVYVDDIMPLTGLIAGGYTKRNPQDRYKSVREIVRKLNTTEAGEDRTSGDKVRGALFRNVDLLSSGERDNREEDIFLPWHKLLPRGMYQPFALRLPFAQVDINVAARRERQEGGDGN